MYHTVSIQTVAGEIERAKKPLTPIINTLYSSINID